MGNDTHIVFVAFQAWGHTKPLCTLAARLTKLRPLFITFFAPRQMYKRVVMEISRNFEYDEWNIQSRIRVVGLNWHEHDMFDLEVVGQNFALEMKKLLNGSSAHCAYTSMDIPPLVPPSTVLVDTFGHSFLKIARGLSNSLKIFAWAPVSLVAVLGLFGPFESNSVGRIQHEVETLSKEPGRDFLDAASAIFNTPTDDIIHVPGLPSMYKYENYPQKPILASPIVGALHLGAHNLFQECDGVVTSSFANTEPEFSLQAMSNFLMETSRQLYVVGPLLPSTQRAAAVEMEQAAKSPEIVTFMNKALQSHGERSLIYISFGTFFWPSNPDHLWMLLDILIERRIPFIFTYASVLATVPDNIAERLRTSGLGIITTWAPQQLVLENPATGWFVTHSGYNSYSESILAGVPMICWPMGADQALNTLHLTDNLDVAYELLEVRTGDGLRPIYRTGKSPSGTLEAVRAEVNSVLDRAFGRDGDQKRANIQKLKDGSMQLWDESGYARRAALEFLDSLSPNLVMATHRTAQVEEVRKNLSTRLLSLAYSSFSPLKLRAHLGAVARALFVVLGMSEDE